MFHLHHKIDIHSLETEESSMRAIIVPVEYVHDGKAK